MSFNRRQFLQFSGALSALGVFGSNAAFAQALNPKQMNPWRNWSGVQTCLPASRITPKNLQELVDHIRQGSGTIRPVGAGHSFSPLVPTDDTLLSLGYFSGLLSHNPDTHQAEFGAGTSMALMGMALKEVGQGFINMADIDKHVAENEHWEMLVITHSDYALAIALNETDEPPTPPLNKAESGGNEFVSLLEKLDKYGSDFPDARRFLLNNLRHFATFEERIGESYEIYSNVRSVRFNEMEYAVPAEQGPDCLREILQLIERNDLPTWFPLEYRYVQADDVPLSMFQGRDSCAISVHQHYQMDHHNLFAAIEPIFWKYNGRPHWGKLHTLNARHLEQLYPQGRFLNAHLRSILDA